MSRVGDNFSINLSNLEAAKQELQAVAQNKINNKFTSFFRKIF